MIPMIVPPDRPRVLRAFGDEMHLHLSGADTGDRFCMFTMVTPPGHGPPPHVHQHEDEWFYPLEGDVEFLCDGKWTAAVPGSVVFMPRGTPHAFRNAGTTPSRILIHTTPAGFENFFEQCAAEFARTGGPDMKHIEAISAEFGISFVSEAPA
jgi:quercetin dioxygenase-like cupin family protein